MGTSSRSLGPVPRGRCKATTSRQRASLLPRVFSRRMVEDIHFFFLSTSSRNCAASTRRCSFSSGLLGCHLASRTDMFSTSRFFRIQYPTNSGVLSLLGSRGSSEGKSSPKTMTPSLSWSKSLKRSRGLLSPVSSGHFTPRRDTPSANSWELMLPLPLRSILLKASRSLPAARASSLRMVSRLLSASSCGSCSSSSCGGCRARAWSVPLALVEALAPRKLLPWGLRACLACEPLLAARPPPSAARPSPASSKVSCERRAGGPSACRAPAPAAEENSAMDMGLVPLLGSWTGRCRAAARASGAGAARCAGDGGCGDCGCGGVVGSSAAGPACCCSSFVLAGFEVGTLRERCCC
mmetsp:Transcript_60289/g.194137  ORF Transcript_60289/g.194137 Transcript_60289/m.194137 type:complete len:352 (-) Transcript_60289:384-1439(-)